MDLQLKAGLKLKYACLIGLSHVKPEKFALVLHCLVARTTIDATIDT